MPSTDTIVSMRVQVLNVSLSVKLKYSLNIQKPVSLTCENIRLPAPTANTINSGEAPAITNGTTIPEAVSAATVADPSVTRSNAAISQPKNKGEALILLASVFTSSPIPLSTRICLKAPPAAIISKIMATPFTPSVQESMALAIGRSCNINVINKAMSKAIVGSEMNIKNACIGPLANASVPKVPAVINTIGERAMIKLLKADGKRSRSSKVMI